MMQTDVITTPQQMLEWKAQAYKHLMSDRQFNFPEWLLEHGEAFGPAIKRPKGLRLQRKKMCYSNSFRALAYQDVDPDEWFYTEGVVLKTDLPIEIDHAWLSNRKGEVIDLTLRGQETAMYYGVPFAWDYVRDQVMKRGYYGLFSNGVFINKDVMDSADEGRAWKKRER
jgi:hypothetical protein